MKVITAFCFVLLLFNSCNSKRNKLNTNEQKLAVQIAIEEQEKLESEAVLKHNTPAIPDNLPQGFRFQEDRSVDEMNPPKHLDILGTQRNIRDFKLSDIATSIKYIKLETPPDLQLLWIHPKLHGTIPSVISDDKYLFIQGLFGITQFNFEGKFQKEIWKNESGINVSQSFVSWSSTELYGITPDNPVSLLNGNLFMRFQDGKNGQVQIVKKEVHDKLVLNTPLTNQEIQKDTLIGNKLLTIKEKYMSRKYPLIFGLSTDSWAGIDHTFSSAQTGHLLVVFNNNGDTLCTFSNPNTIENWSKSLVRAGEPYTYYYKNQLTILAQYSDTIFRLIPPNRFLPVYLLDFGKDKIVFFEGVDPDTDLSQKLMKHSIFETQQYLFVRYTRNSASPRNLKSKSVTFYNAIYNKRENKLYHFPKQSLNPVNLSNDIDGGISFWPEFVTPEGKMLMMVSGKKIKDYVNSDEFRKRELPDEQRQKQIKIAGELNEFDIIVMLVK